MVKCNVYRCGFRLGGRNDAFEEEGLISAGLVQSIGG